MHRFFAILERDLRKFVRNPLVVVVSILMPIIYLVILGNSFQGDLKNLPVAVVDLDRGPFAADALNMLRAVEAGPKSIDVIRVADHGEALSGLRQGAFKAVLIIPENSSRKAAAGGSPVLGLYLDNSETISAKTISAAIYSALPYLNLEFEPIRQGAGVEMRSIDVYRKIDYDQSLIPGVVIMAIFLGAMTTGAFNLIMDRFLGIEESYFLTPLTKRDIVMGLTASGLLITTIIAVTVLFVASLISGIYLWLIMDIWNFLLAVLVIIFSTIGMQGLMFIIAGRVSHPRIMGVLGGFLNVILFFPSGAIYPTESFPKWLKYFAIINPETYSVHALKSILFKGAGFMAVKDDLLYLIVFAGISTIAGTFVFKRAL